MTHSPQAGIEHIDALPYYEPPGHSGTHNIRLVSAEQCPDFEMVRGRMQPGGEASVHAHDHAFQAIYILGGTAEVVLGEGAPQRCGAGSIVRIPAKVDHYVKSVGSAALEMVIVYSPPLRPATTDRSTEGV